MRSFTGRRSASFFPSRPGPGLALRCSLSLDETSSGRSRDATAEQDEAFGFGHALIRDAAYEGIPKERRAQLHVLLATRLERRRFSARARGEPPRGGRALPRRARLRDQATDDLSQQCGAATRNCRCARARSRRRPLCGAPARACSVAGLGRGRGNPPAPHRVREGARRGRAAGTRASRVRRGFARTPARCGLRSLELRAELGVLSADAQTRMSFLMADLQAAAERAIPVFEGERDERGLARSWFLVHWALFEPDATTGRSTPRRRPSSTHGRRATRASCCAPWGDRHGHALGLDAGRGGAPEVRRHPRAGEPSAPRGGFRRARPRRVLRDDGSVRRGPRALPPLDGDLRGAGASDLRGRRRLRASASRAEGGTPGCRRAAPARRLRAAQR